MIRSLILALTLAVASTATAGSTVYYADVVDVRPVYSRVCQETRPYGYEEPRSRTAPVLGAIVGAAAGNQIGGGSGRDAATLAGAALGYSMTRDAQERNRHRSQQYRGHTSCYDRPSHYEVTFRGPAGMERVNMAYDPGRTVRVRIETYVEDAL
jgi:uncharacterized protein YcfJ